MTIAWVLAAVIGLLSSLFYVNHTMGISVMIMTVLVVVAMVHNKKSAGISMGHGFYMTSGYMILLSPVFAVTTVPLIRFWAGFILTVLFLALAVGEQTFSWPLWVKEGLTSLFGALSQSMNFFTHGSKVTSKNKKILGQVILGMVVALPILAVAAGLLASADAVMDDFIGNIFETVKLDDLGLWIWRLVVFLVVSALLYGYSIWMSHVQSDAVNGENQVKTVVKLEVIPPVVSGTILVLLNGLYLIFAYIQIKFLFLGGQANVIGGYNYADYARSGFFELVALSVLNTIGILVINRFTKVHLFNHISLSITALCTFIMIASSWFKMFLYESAYGYTQLRLYVYMILGFMILFMALITLGIWKRHLPVIEWSIVIGLCYFLVISYVNVDAIIVTNNVARYEDHGEIDLSYLFNELSRDGAPQVIAFTEQNKELLKTYGLTKSYGEMVSRLNPKDEERLFFEYNYRYEAAVKAAKSIDHEQ